MEEKEIVETTEQEQALPKLFTLCFRIPMEDYYNFHVIMGTENAKKSKRKTVLLGWVELIFGLGFLVSLLTTQTQGGLFYYFLIAVMIVMGLYGILFYRFFYPRSMRRAVTRQYEKTPYLQNEVEIDFYANRLIEHVQDKEAVTFWHSIKELRETDALYMVMIENNRCLLIPKSQVGEQKEALESLLRDVCANFEKPRYQL